MNRARARHIKFPPGGIKCAPHLLLGSWKKDGFFLHSFLHCATYNRVSNKQQSVSVASTVNITTAFSLNLGAIVGIEYCDYLGTWSKIVIMSHICQQGDKYFSTDLPAYSDSLGTRGKVSL